MPRLLKSNTDTLLEGILTRSSERKIFQRFLETEKDGLLVTDGLYQQANKVALMVEDESRGMLREQATQAIIQKYKKARVANGLSAYDEMVLGLIAVQEQSHLLVSKIRRGKIAPQNLPDDFPGKRKRAEVILQGKIAADLKPADITNYLVEKAYVPRLRRYARDLFLAVNDGGEEKAVDFLLLLYSLDRIMTSEPITPLRLRKRILGCLMRGEPLDIVHMKSLRFTYPAGRRLKILENTSAVLQDGLPGEKRGYPSEEVIFSRLNQFERIFKETGIRVQSTVIVADFDLDYCFPPRQSLVPSGDLALAEDSARRYLDNLKGCYSRQVVISFLSEFLRAKGLTAKYDDLFKSLVAEGNRGGGSRIKERVLEMRVNEQYEHYRQMFGAYSRDLARYTAVCQMASLLALSVVFESFSGTPLLVIDSRGFENELIGGCNPNSVVKFFTKLKDPVEIKKC